jgi:hypothetical protein
VNIKELNDLLSKMEEAGFSRAELNNERLRKAAKHLLGDAAGKDSVDAARYRWLRSEACAKSLPHAYAPHDFRPIFGDELDAAIDAIASLTKTADGEKT